MKISMAWLREHLETQATVQEIADKLCEIGFEVEDIEDQSASLSDITVALVEQAQRHPQSDHLNICQVNDGSDQRLQIICGAGNVRSGMKVALVHVGGMVPKLGTTLKKAKLCGTESQGMLCSYEELNLNIKDAEDGIIDLPADAPVGAPLAQVLNLNEQVLTVSITPNRGDCFSVRGIARELAAAGLGTLKELPVAQSEVAKLLSGQTAEQKCSISIETDQCRCFYGAVIEGVSNQESPAWLQQRLLSIGHHPINALVDVTNFICFDLGQPLHVYDLDTIEKGIIVRQAKQGENIVALNGEKYDLTPGMMVVADEKKPLVIAGVMGGEKTGSQMTTTRVLLEAAVFEAVSVSKTGQALNLTSESRMRFERGIDERMTPVAFAYALSLIQKICGGKVLEASCVTSRSPVTRSQSLQSPIVLTLKGLQEISGDYSQTLAKGGKILELLGFSLDSGSGAAHDSIRVIAPSWRHDIENEADLVEEIIRIQGYKNLPCQTLIPAKPKIQSAVSVLSVQKLKQALCHRGYHEVYTLPFVNQHELSLFGKGKEGSKDGLEVLSPLNVEMPFLRPSLLPSLLKIVESNQGRNLKYGAIFECESVFESGENQNSENQPVEKKMLCGVRFGQTQKHWLEPSRSVDLFDVKADAEIILDWCRASSFQIEGQKAPHYYHPGRSGAFYQGNKQLGVFGDVHPSVLNKYGITVPVVAFEIELTDYLLERCGKNAVKPKEFSNLQPIVRDFAFLLDSEVSAEALVKAVQKSNKMIQSVRVFDLFEGAGVPQGKKSIALQVLIQPEIKTLTEEDLKSLMQQITEAVQKKLGGQLRGG